MLMAIRRDLLRDLPPLGVSLAGLAALVLFLRAVRVESPTTAALGFLVIVLVTATLARLRVAVLASVSAMMALNYYFLPPVGNFTIADAQNWVALFAFL